MRKRKEIIDDGARTDIKILEVLLDIRDLLKANPKKKKGGKNQNEN